MLDDLKKSLHLVLNERITSPFSGAFLFSWIIWNWRLFYYLLMEDTSVKIIERLSYADEHFINLSANLFKPFLSAVVLVVIYPFITTGALWFWLRFKKWQADLRNKIEGQQLLTLQQSIAIRLEIQSQQDKFDKILQSKEAELKLQEMEIVNLKQKLNHPVSQDPIKAATEEVGQMLIDAKELEEIRNIINKDVFKKHFPTVLRIIQGGYPLRHASIPSEFLAYLEGNNFIVKTGSSGQYEFTQMGKLLAKEFSKSIIA
jgi:hypothetical protein